MRWLGLLLVACGVASAREVVTNSIRFLDAPPWLTEGRLEKATGRIENYLEWDVHRITVHRYATPQAFAAGSTLRYAAVAFFRRADGTIHLGPSITDENFDRFFGHELVHAIFFQKYKGAIAPWLEEGLANYIGKTSSPDYRWLAKQPRIAVTSLVHPDKDGSGSKYHYQASTAVIEMIAARCELPELLRLAVGAKLTTYLKTYCEIPDVDAAFRAWVEKKAGTK